jgi:hypothetical protein
MEMLVIGVITIVAFAAVLIPLFRRRPGAGDAREFEGAPDTAGDAASTGEGPADVAANAAPATAPASADTSVSDTTGAGVDELELEVTRYRTAVRAGTVCRKCGQANPAESMFCFDCGERLPRDEAKEFE